MNWQDIVAVLIAVAAAFYLLLRLRAKRGGACSGCQVANVCKSPCHPVQLRLPVGEAKPSTTKH